MESEHNLDPVEGAAPNTKKRMVLMLVGTALLLGLITGFGPLKGLFGKGPAGPLPAVSRSWASIPGSPP